MKKIKYIAIFSLLAMCSVKGIAQTAKSAYFLDGTFHNYKLNPAMDAERGFFSLGVGNLSLGTNSNVGISHFLFPKEDHLTTFMSGTVKQDEFLNRLPQSIRFGESIDETLMALGFRMLGGYTTLSVSLHSSASIALPKGFFEFAKKGLQEDHYDFSGININTMNYAAATLGYSHEIFDGFRLGVNLKYLMGIGYADATFDKLNIEMSEDQWMVEAHAQAQAALLTKVTLEEGKPTLGNLQMASFTPAASGFAVDLGVVYDMDNIVPGLTLSGSILDLGKINWQYMMSIQNDATTIRWEGFKEANIYDLEGALKDEVGKLEEYAGQMMELNVSDFRAESTKLNATMYLGAEYNLPFYRNLSFAVLYGKNFSPYAYSGWEEVRGYVNYAPIKWLEFSANAGQTTFGTSWGWMFNFHPKLVSFFVGSDYMISYVTPQYIPLNDLNYHITFGVNMPLGKRR